MATLAVTWTAGQEAGGGMRALANAIEQAATTVGDSVTGASVTLTFDNAPSTGHVSVLVAGGGLATQTTYFV